MALQAHFTKGPEYHQDLSRTKKGNEKNNKHEQPFGIVPGMGGGQIGLCVALVLGEKGKHINKNPRKFHENAGTVPGQSRDNPVKNLFMCFLVYWFDLALKKRAIIRGSEKGLAGGGLRPPGPRTQQK